MKFCWYHSDTNPTATCNLNFDINLNVKKMSRMLCVCEETSKGEKANWHPPPPLSFLLPVKSQPLCTMTAHKQCWQCLSNVCLLSHKHFVHKAWGILMYVSSEMFYHFSSNTQVGHKLKIYVITFIYVTYMGVSLDRAHFENVKIQMFSILYISTRTK